MSNTFKNKFKYVCLISTYNKIYGRVRQSKNDKYRDVIWEKGVTPPRSRIKPERYHIYEWI